MNNRVFKRELAVLAALFRRPLFYENERFASTKHHPLAKLAISPLRNAHVSSCTAWSQPAVPIKGGLQQWPCLTEQSQLSYIRKQTCDASCSHLKVLPYRAASSLLFQNSHCWCLLLALEDLAAQRFP